MKQEVCSNSHPSSPTATISNTFVSRLLFCFFLAGMNSLMLTFYIFQTISWSLKLGVSLTELRFLEETIDIFLMPSTDNEGEPILSFFRYFIYQLRIQMTYLRFFIYYSSQNIISLVLLCQTLCFELIYYNRLCRMLSPVRIGSIFSFGVDVSSYRVVWQAFWLKLTVTPALLQRFSKTLRTQKNSTQSSLFLESKRKEESLMTLFQNYFGLEVKKSLAIEQLLKQPEEMTLCRQAKHSIIRIQSKLVLPSLQNCQVSFRPNSSLPCLRSGLRTVHCPLELKFLVDRLIGLDCLESPGLRPDGFEKVYGHSPSFNNRLCISLGHGLFLVQGLYVSFALLQIIKLWSRPKSDS